MLVLQQVGDLYLGNVIESILELIVRSEGGSEGHVERIVGGGISADISGGIVGIELDINGAGCASPHLGEEGVGAVGLLVWIVHVAKGEGIAALCCVGPDHDGVGGGVGVALSVVGG